MKIQSRSSLYFYKIYVNLNLNSILLVINITEQARKVEVQEQHSPNNFLRNTIHWSYVSDEYRSNHRKCSGRKGILRNFAKFTRKHLRQSLFFKKVACLWHRCFPVNFVKFPRTPFLQNTLGGCFWIFLCSRSAKYSFFYFSHQKNSEVSLNLVSFFYLLHFFKNCFIG